MLAHNIHIDSIKYKILIYTYILKNYYIMIYKLIGKY